MADRLDVDEIAARLDGPGLCSGHEHNGQPDIYCECADEDVALLIAEVRRWRDVFTNCECIGRPCEHHPALIGL